MKNNLSVLVLVGLAVFVAFLLGRCSKKPLVVEKIVEREVTVYPDDIPMPEPVTVREVRTVYDYSGTLRVKEDFDKYRDSVEVLLASMDALRDLVPEVRFVRDTVHKYINVYVPQDSIGDVVSGERYEARWSALLRGKLDKFSLDVEVNCPELVPRNRSFAFGSGFKTDLDVDWDVPFSISYEKNGFEKGLTWYPRGQAVSFDLKYRFKW